MNYSEESWRPTQELQNNLRSATGRRHVELAGSGTAALMAACSLAPREKSRVLIPAIACPQVAYAVWYANREPVLADVRESDATIDPERVAQALHGDPRIGTVVAVHLYGHRADMDALRVVTRANGVLLIEDAAQAQGGVHPNGCPYGGSGDASILSFGHTKIIDAGGGGALLFDDDVLAAQAHSVIVKLSPPRDRIDELRAHYARIFYGLWGAYCFDNRFATLFRQLPELFRDMFLHGCTAAQIERISKALPCLAEELAHRRRVFRTYDAELRRLPGVRLFQVDAYLAAPWRFSFRVPVKVRDQILTSLRGAGLHASGWYPSLAGWCVQMSPGCATRLPVADAIGSEVINLWVDRTTSDTAVADAVRVIAAALSDNRAPHSRGTADQGK